MPYIVCRRPSGVNHVQFVGAKDECILYEVAVRKLFTMREEAEKECKLLEKERRRRHVALKNSQMKLLDNDDVPGLEYPP